MPEPVLWKREDHTAAKHNLLRNFFVKWLSIHSGYFAQRGGGLVRVFDGFAGPGVYLHGEPGSPRLLLDELLDNPNISTRWSAVRYELAFVERNHDRAEKLNEVLSDAEASRRVENRWASNVSWTVTEGSYENHIPRPVSAKHSALFLFLDPFGYSHSPMSLTTKLVQQPKSDTLIFLPLSFVHRFVDRDGQDVALDRFFGTTRWREIPDGPTRPQAMLSLFQEQLRSAGLVYTLPFQLKPPDRKNEYWIVGASGHTAGFESIKAGFWAVDPVNGQGFAAPRPAPEGQGTLFGALEPQGPDTSPLLEALQAHFGKDAFAVEEAIEFTQHSRFLDTHLKERTLGAAERDGKLLVDRSSGGRRFKEGCGTTMRFI